MKKITFTSISEADFSRRLESLEGKVNCGLKSEVDISLYAEPLLQLSEEEILLRITMLEKKEKPNGIFICSIKHLYNKKCFVFVDSKATLPTAGFFKNGMNHESGSHFHISSIITFLILFFVAHFLILLLIQGVNIFSDVEVEQRVLISVFLVFISLYTKIQLKYKIRKLVGI